MSLTLVPELGKLWKIHDYILRKTDTVCTQMKRVVASYFKETVTCWLSVQGMDTTVKMEAYMVEVHT